MNAHINEEELKLLTYLHEHVDGFGKRHRLDAKKISDGLRMDIDALCRCGSFLEQHGLIGMVTIDTTTLDEGTEGSFALTAIFLTGLGEDFIRELEQEPGIARKLTVAAVSELWQAGKGIIVGAAATVLGEIAVGRHP